MKYVLVLFVFLSSFYLYAGDTSLQAKAAYFYPTSGRFQDIYSGGGIYGLEFNGSVWRQLHIWTSIDFFSKNGHSIGENDKTNIFFMPIGLGLKYIYDIKNFSFYFGAGAITTYFRTKDYNPYVIPIVSKWGIGAIIKTGCFLKLPHHVFLGLNVDYSFMNIKFHTINAGLPRYDADLSGVTVGGSIGYLF